MMAQRGGAPYPKALSPDSIRTGMLGFKRRLRIRTRARATVKAVLGPKRSKIEAAESKADTAESKIVNTASKADTAESKIAAAASKADTAESRIRGAASTANAAKSSQDVRTIASAPLLDVQWYSSQVGCKPTPTAVAQHYLTQGAAAGVSPHPLFDPKYYALHPGAKAHAEDPFIVYQANLSSLELSPHPLFDVALYAEREPAAVDYPGGVLQHYLDVGAPAGVSPNTWYVPDVGAEPGGLSDWIRNRRVEWEQRSATAPRLTPSKPTPDSSLQQSDDRSVDPAPSGSATSETTVESDETCRGVDGRPCVTTVLLVGADLALLPAMALCVTAQTLTDWELVIVHSGDTAAVAAALGDVALDNRVTLTSHRTTVAGALNHGLERARGRYVSWLTSGDEWKPHYLRHAIDALQVGGHLAVHTSMAVRAPFKTAATGAVKQRTRYAAAPATPERLAAGLRVELSALVVKTSLAIEVGGFDEALPAASDHDFVLKVAQRTSLQYVHDIGVIRRASRAARWVTRYSRREQPWLDHAGLDTWHDVVLNRHLIAWDEISARRPGTVSIIIPTYHDWRMTTIAVEAVVNAAAKSRLEVEVIVLANGCPLDVSLVLDSLPLRFPTVTVVHTAVNHGFALGNNLALAHVSGDIVVFLNNDTEAREGWLEPLAGALEDPEVLGSQALLLYPSGSIQSAGVAFPTTGGVPYALLAHFPVEDAAGIEAASLSALTGAALAMRLSDVVALRGFDPLFRNGMEDIDLGLRMLRIRPGRFVVRPDSIVVHHESKSPGRYAHQFLNRRILLDRWGDQMPGDDATLWPHVGYEVVRHEVRHVPADVERRVASIHPVLVRRPTVSINEAQPSLRWAIKNPAPNDATAETWGDTHFARRLAVALRGLGQQVVIDHRPEFERQTGHFDDAVLVLRGVAPYQPSYGQVSLAWLISHPEMLSRSEARMYDRVMAASEAWAHQKSQEWGIRIDPLLQATDPGLFHPDRAEPDTGHPVLFVGGSRKLLRPIVRDAVDQDLPLSVYGPQWQGLIPERYVKDTSYPNAELGAAYRAAGVVLNDHWEAMRVDGFISNRLFDAAAAGARVVTDDVAGLDNLFGRSVQVARDAVDLKRLVCAEDLDAVFGDDEERRAVAARVRVKHSFTARARRLIDVALECGARPNSWP